MHVCASTLTLNPWCLAVFILFIFPSSHLQHVPLMILCFFVAYFLFIFPSSPPDDFMLFCYIPSFHLPFLTPCFLVMYHTYRGGYFQGLYIIFTNLLSLAMSRKQFSRIFCYGRYLCNTFKVFQGFIFHEFGLYHKILKIKIP